MKIGVLFWGFKDLNFVSDCANMLKKNHGINDFYMQISAQEKTITLLDLFPEEIIRANFDDLNLFYKWLSKNHRKNILIVVDFWFYLFNKNIFSNSVQIKKIFDEPFNFLVCCPEFYHNSVFDFRSKKLVNMSEKTSELFKNLKILHEIWLNCSSSIELLSYPPSFPMLNLLCGKDLFYSKKILFLSFVPSILSSFPALFISKESLLEGLVQKIVSIVDVMQSLKNNNEDNYQFKKHLKGDILNIYYKDQKTSKNQKKNGLTLKLSLDKFYTLNSKDESTFLLWLIHMAILEYEHTEISSSENAINEKNPHLFSSVSM